jgi:hypothetical protein
MGLFQEKRLFCLSALQTACASILVEPHAFCPYTVYQ